MKLTFGYLKKYRWAVVMIIALKCAGTFLELFLPYVLEHLVDNVAPTKQLGMVFFWGFIMLALATLTRFLNVFTNRRSVRISKDAAFEIRRDLFWHTLNLSGNQVDDFGLPSLTSRMTTDSYNVQDFLRMFQTMGVRAPMLLLGGIVVTMSMDSGMGLILCILAPVAVVAVVGVSMKGVPMYTKVQQSMDGIVRVMRENITGIRVVKALSKEDYERRRFDGVNAEMSRNEIRTGVIMTLPGPIMTLLLNIGLTIVVFVGARRVDAGLTKPGVILAFLTYFNMILMGVMGLSRMFLTMSKANASAARIAAVIGQRDELAALPEEALSHTDSGDFIRFEGVSFRYGRDSGAADAVGFAGEQRQMSLADVSFSVAKGGSLGIIGPTGCGKTTIINLLMRFYDATEGSVFLEGRDVRGCDKDELHRRFGVVFQNDVVFADTLEENISFGRGLSAETVRSAAADARAAEFIEAYNDGYGHRTAIHGGDLSGGQRQRILIARALAADPDILILDDASSALDYSTAAALRRAIREHHSATTTVIVAQRVSSIMNLDQILVMDEGRVIGKGTHEELLETCPQYRDIYETQMGEVG